MTLQEQVRAVLEDQNWHCRRHEYTSVPSGQLAGGGGIQGLQRGNKSRPGLVIESRTELCEICQARTRQDRWTGELRSSNAAANIPLSLRRRVLDYYGYVDAIEGRARPSHELVIDHRFPMERWGAAEQPNDAAMSEEDIEQKFQLLKKDDSGNHNLLKSRDCERCIDKKIRGRPFSIAFWYSGGEFWPEDVPDSGPEAEEGCIGCGWYDFAAWRNGLNHALERSDRIKALEDFPVREHRSLYDAPPNPKLIPTGEPPTETEVRAR